LSAGQALALAELLRVLGCGEESAELAFDHLANSFHSGSLREALARISADELKHQRLLDSLRRYLPTPSPDPVLQSTMRRFFLRLAHRDVMIHCARIVAIDSALCLLLGALRRRGTPVSAHRMLSAVFKRIHRDEAMHVAIASQCAASLLATARGADIVTEARDQLARVLAFRASALDTLEVDPGPLFARLRRGLPLRAFA
jgi:hypothetical protein